MIVLMLLKQECCLGFLEIENSKFHFSDKSLFSFPRHGKVLNLA